MEITFLKNVTINDEVFKEGDTVETDAYASLDADTVVFLTEQEAVAAEAPPEQQQPTETETEGDA